MDLSKYSDEELNAMLSNQGQQENAAPTPAPDLSKYSDAELQSMLPQETRTQKPVSGKEAFVAGMVKGIPFGGDLSSALAAQVYGGDREAYKAKLEDIAARGAAQHPYLSIGGSLATGIPVGVALTPARALQGSSMLARAVKGGLTGGAFGTLYGAGEGKTAKERAANAITQGVYSVPFGIGGSLAADVLSAGYQGTRSLAKRAANLLNKNAGANTGVGINIQSTGQATAMGAAPTAAQPVAQPSFFQDLQQGLKNTQTDPILSMTSIPLSKGQATQDAATMALENSAAAGVYGKAAQDTALAAREIQSQAAKDVLTGSAGVDLTPEVPADAIEKLRTGLKQSYASAKAKTNAAYQKVGDLSQDAPLQIGAEYVKETIVPSLKDWARKGSNGRPWDLVAPEMTNAKRLYNQAASIVDMKKLTAVNFFRMEDWRGRVSQAIANSKTPSEKAFLSGMLQRYDTAMGQLPREAIKSGDDAILKAMETARGARKSQGVLFERSKLVKDVLTNDNLTNEQFANTLNSLGNRSGAYVRDILRTAANDPTKQEALRQQVKQSVLGSILNKSLSSEISQTGLEAGNVANMVSFDKLATNLDKLVKNRTLFNQIMPDKESQAVILDALEKSRLIKSYKPGSKNYSNTAYTLLSVLGQISPAVKSANIFGVGIGSSLKAMGEAGAEQDLLQSLSPVLKNTMQEHNGAITNFGQKYGRAIMNAGATGTQRPFLKDASGNQYNYPEGQQK